MNCPPSESEGTVPATGRSEIAKGLSAYDQLRNRLAPRMMIRSQSRHDLLRLILGAQTRVDPPTDSLCEDVVHHALGKSANESANRITSVATASVFGVWTSG